MRVLMKLLLALIFCNSALAESTINCPAGKIDVLDWMTLDADLRSSKHMAGSHDIHSVVHADKFYWLKNASGDTWDINLYDNNWIYLWITERAWGTPNDYKRHHLNTNVRLAPRCARTGLPGESQQIYDTGYRIASSCQEGPVFGLNKALTQFWGPYTAVQPGLEPSRPAIGGVIANNTPVYVVAWLWNCDNNYAKCQSKEEYVLTQRHGLVRWNLWNLSGGGYVLQQRSTFNQLVNGAATPSFPCF